MGRRKQQDRSLALLASGAAAAAPMAVAAARKYGPQVMKRIATRWRENAGPVRRRVRARRARRNGAEDAPLSSTPQITQGESSGARYASVGGGAMIPRPAMLSNKRGKWLGGANGPRVRKAEYIGDVNGSVAFASIPFPGYSDGRYLLNPGLEYSFPWLSAIASNFESYTAHSVALHYIPSTNLNATGNLYMVPVIDPGSTGTPVSKEAVSQYMDVVDTNVKFGACCNFPLNRKTQPTPWRYVRNRLSDATSNLELFDLGFYELFVGGCADTTVQGELWIEYDIEFFNPRFRSQLTRVDGGRALSGGTTNAGNPLGAAPVVDADATGFTINATSVVTLLNSGTYLVALVVAGTSPTGLIASSNSTVTQQATTAGAATSIYIYSVLSNQSNATLTVTGGGTITSSALLVGAAPQSSFSSLPPKSTIDDLQAAVNDLTTRLELLAAPEKIERKFVYLK
jgi:hypothetical protein